MYMIFWCGFMYEYFIFINLIITEDRKPCARSLLFWWKRNNFKRGTPGACTHICWQYRALANRDLIKWRKTHDSMIVYRLLNNDKNTEYIVYKFLFYKYLDQSRHIMAYGHDKCTCSLHLYSSIHLWKFTILEPFCSSKWKK